MPQGRLPFQCEIEGGSSGLTALAGLHVYLDLMAVSGLRKSFDRHVVARNGGQGWTDGQMGKSFVMLNLAGGDCVDDLKTLEGDEGFCRVLQRAELTGLPRSKRREMARRWHKEKRRSVPLPSTAFRYLNCFHDEVRRQPARPSHGEGTLPRHSDVRAAADGRIPYRDTTEDCRNGAHSIGLTRPG